MVYTGIGSRSTPPSVLEQMRSIAVNLAQDGWVLRSGAAPGADTAFETGCISANGPMEIYLPWPSFETGRIGRLTPSYIPRPLPAAETMAAQFHPAWDRVKPTARPLHARNCHQVLGPSLDPRDRSDLLICWTEGGLSGGGTGQAIRIARHYNIPVYDLFHGIDGLYDLTHRLYMAHPDS